MELTLSFASSSTMIGLALRLLASQIRTLLSNEPDIRTESSWPANATQLILAVWPCELLLPNRRSVVAAWTSHRKTLLSPPTEANDVLSEEHARSRTA